MPYKKHICGYPIYVEQEDQDDGGSLVDFRDEPRGSRLVHCPGCGGKLNPWRMKPAEEMPEGEVEASDLGETLADLVEKVEAALWGVDPEGQARWSTLTAEARQRLSRAGICVQPPPWAEEERPL
ncbi:MAG: hypothetical protein ACLFU8_16065 [Anaerolineales bacterium]